MSTPRPSRWSAAGALLLLCAALGCRRDARGGVVVELWAMGREGEVVAQLIPEFERRHPSLRVRVQQVPWSAAHEKLVTATSTTPARAPMPTAIIPEPNNPPRAGGRCVSAMATPPESRQIQAASTRPKPGSEPSTVQATTARHVAASAVSPREGRCRASSSPSGATTSASDATGLRKAKPTK